MNIKRTLLIVAALAAQATSAWALDSAQVVREGTTLTVSWSAKRPVDVYVADRADAAIGSARLISQADADGRFTLPEAGTTRRYFLLREAGAKDPVRIAERLLPLERGSNFRDIGGYAAAGGKHVRWGLIYRSGATPLLTNADVAQIKALGLRDLVDLRSSEERVIAPTKLTGIRYTAIDYSMMTMMGDRRALSNGVDLYRSFPTFFAPQLRIVFDDLVRRQVPLAYHCSAGQDRTGFTTAMILSALGVPRATIVEDYHLSTALRSPQNEMPPIDAVLARSNPVAGLLAAYQKDGKSTAAQPLKDANGKAFLDGAFEVIEARWGSVDTYLEQEIGLTKADLAVLRRTYLE
jgi:protein-tyrosine phosphatase